MNNKAKLLIGTCLALTVLSGVLRGMIDQRFGMPVEMAEAAKRVATLPTNVGDWEVVQESELEESAREMLRCAASVVRTYADRKTGEVVSLIFLVGPAGPLAIHTPEVCYGSNSFTTVEPRKQRFIEDVNGDKHPFSVITFAENKVGRRLQRVYYAWNNGEDWLAPSSPRTSFAGVPMLYKVQIATNAIGKSGELDAVERFLKESLPIWKDICR